MSPVSLLLEAGGTAAAGFGEGERGGAAPGWLSSPGPPCWGCAPFPPANPAARYPCLPRAPQLIIKVAWSLGGLCARVCYWDLKIGSGKCIQMKSIILPGVKCSGLELSFSFSS